MVFVYLVTIRLRREADVPVFLEHFEPLRKYCNTHEVNTLTYEAVRDEMCPRTLLILERYRSVRDLEETHRSSEAFKAFCEQLTKLDIIEDKKNGRFYTPLPLTVSHDVATPTATGQELSSSSGVLVFCGSRVGEKPEYCRAAECLGRAIAQRGRTLVYGGGTVGVMGALARSVDAAGGAITSIIPRALMPKELSGDSLGSVLVTDTMAERKALMFALAGVVIALPGGIGTFDEFFEVLTLFQLGAYRPRIGVANVNGFFEPLLALLRHTISEGFLDASAMDYFVVKPTAEELIATLLDDPSYVLPNSAVMLKWKAE